MTTNTEQMGSIVELSDTPSLEEKNAYLSSDVVMSGLNDPVRLFSIPTAHKSIHMDSPNAAHIKSRIDKNNKIVYQCTVCKTDTIMYSELKNHIKLNCLNQTDAFSTSSDAEVHNLVPEEVDPLKLPKPMAMSHIKKTFIKIKNKKNSKILTGIIYDCSVCNTGNIAFKDLKKHFLLKCSIGNEKNSSKRKPTQNVGKSDLLCTDIHSPSFISSPGITTDTFMANPARLDIVRKTHVMSSFVTSISGNQGSLICRSDPKPPVPEVFGTNDNLLASFHTLLEGRESFGNPKPVLQPYEPTIWETKISNTQAKTHSKNMPKNRGSTIGTSMQTEKIVKAKIFTPSGTSSITNENISTSIYGIGSTDESFNQPISAGQKSFVSHVKGYSTGKDASGIIAYTCSVCNTKKIEFENLSFHIQMKCVEKHTKQILEEKIKVQKSAKECEVYEIEKEPVSRSAFVKLSSKRHLEVVPQIDSLKYLKDSDSGSTKPHPNLSDSVPKVHLQTKKCRYKPKPRKSVCMYCNVPYKNPESLEMHNVFRRESTCSYCGRMFCASTALRLHLKTHQAKALSVESK